ncbi:hypothetical protein BaRGS_00004532 [Batillaria attramentaria]|uniref:Carrier domain-containing protein n=1 Tax=Batillaria attramentaria TaxID=370345 RepID=A0ABD0LYZ6_9CAEN
MQPATNSLHSHLPHMGLLDLCDDVSEIIHEVTTLQGCHRENQTLSPKVLTATGHFFLVTDADSSKRSHEKDIPLGTILEIVDDTLLVKTSSQLILLTVAELDGTPIVPGKFRLYGLSPGSCLQNVHSSKEFVHMMAALHDAEEFWVHELQRYEPTTFTRQKLLNRYDDLTDDPDALTVQSTVFKLPALDNPEKISSEYVSLASFVLFIARVCCSDTVHLGLLAKKSGVPAQYKELCSDICPGIFETDLHSRRETAIEKCCKTIVKIFSAGTFLKGVFYRYADLRERREEVRHNLVAAAASSVHEADVSVKSILTDCNFLVLLSPEQMEIIYFANIVHGSSSVLDTLRYYPPFLTSLFSLSRADSLLQTQLLSSEELVAFSRAPKPPCEQPDLMFLFVNQVHKSPGAVALKTTQGQLTYSETLQAVSDLATMLDHHMPESYRVRKRCIGLHLPKSMAYVLSTLACVRVGCPFVPLPADLPKDRLVFIVKDTGVIVMITDELIARNTKFQSLLSDPGVLFKMHLGDMSLVVLELSIDTEKSPEYLESLTSFGAPSVTSLGAPSAISLSVAFTTSVDAPSATRLGVPSASRLCVPSATCFGAPSDISFGKASETSVGDYAAEDVPLQDDCCYVIYTSGSTGRPKGVQVKQSGVVNMARGLISDLDLQPTDITAQFASISFDTSIWEIFPTLLSGGTLAILLENQRLGKEFVHAMCQLQVNVITLTPSVLNICNPENFPTLTKICAAGETCMLSTAIKWTSRRQQSPARPVRFFNSYGPAETTVGATTYEFKQEHYVGVPNQELSIGTAMNGVELYLLDDFMKPVPPGIVGEIYIGGAGVSGGYIGHAAYQNAYKFLPNPFVHSDETSGGERKFLLYKTGDHAIQESNGRVTFLGRLDNQVKIRGNRVDLCEIEQVMMQNEHVDFAVVVLHKCATSSEPTLAAYVSPPTVCVDEVKVRLSHALPSYMLPAFIKLMDVKELPRSNNGKVNRKALEVDESVHDSQFMASGKQMKKTQLTVARLLLRALNLGDELVYSMQPSSSFKALGGSSIHFALLQRLFEDVFHYRVSMNEIASADTVEEFAGIISRRKRMLKANETVEDSSVDSIEGLGMDMIRDSALDLEADTCCHCRQCMVGSPTAKADPHLYENGTSGSHKMTDWIKDIGSSVDPVRTSQRLKILLSGATGFVGAFLLVELLEQTDAHVLCMVRGKSPTHGMNRLADNLAKYGLWKESYSARVEIVLSDLSQCRLGTAEDVYHRICAEVDVVFINAAEVNFNTTYYDHRKVNVLATREFIRVAMTYKRKFLFFVSSLSVFLYPSEPGLVMGEEDMLDDPLLVEGGYGQSKWVGDRLVQQALQHLPGGAIFRPGNVTGRSTDGAGPTDDMFVRCMVGMRQMGSVPDADFPFDLMPVDFCSKAMVEIVGKVLTSSDASQTQQMPTVYHLYNIDTIPFVDLFAGSAVRTVTLTEWRRELWKVMDNPHLVPLTPFFMSKYWDRATCTPLFSTSNTDHAISPQTAQLLKPATQLLTVYKQFLGLSDSENNRLEHI